MLSTQPPHEPHSSQVQPTRRCKPHRGAVRQIKLIQAPPVPGTGQSAPAQSVPETGPPQRHGRQAQSRGIRTRGTSYSCTSNPLSLLLCEHTNYPRSCPPCSSSQSLLAYRTYSTATPPFPNCKLMQSHRHLST